MIPYVPTHTRVQPVSPESQELAYKLKHVIREYKQSHPRLSDGEVQQAIRMAAGRMGAGVQRTWQVLALTIAAVVAVLLGLFVFLRAGG